MRERERGTDCYSSGASQSNRRGSSTFFCSSSEPTARNQGHLCKYKSGLNAMRKTEARCITSNEH